MAGVYGEGGEDGENFLLEVGLQVGALFLVEVDVVEEVNAMIGQLRPENGLEMLVLFGKDGMEAIANIVELLLGTATVGGEFTNFGFDLLFESGHANHKEFVEVGTDNRHEFKAFEEGDAIVEGFVENPIVKFEPA